MNSDIKKGAFITLGKYPQNDTTGKISDPIEWQVLDVQDGKALLISKCGLDNVMYHSLNTSMTWERCELRAWLQGEFADKAFNDDEKKLILKTTNDNPASKVHGAPGGPCTEDTLFCLSIDEVCKYMPEQKDRVCAPSAYTKAKGAFTHPENGHCWWWLRNPGYYPSDAAGINYYGYLHESGDNITSPSDAVRPAMWISIG